MLYIELLNGNRVVINLLVINLTEIMPYNIHCGVGERALDARLAFNKEGGRNEPIQNYNDEVNECKDNTEPLER